MYNQKVVVIVDARKRVQWDDLQVIGRHNDYIQEFRKIRSYEKSSLYIVQPSSKLFKSSENSSDQLTVLRLSLKDLFFFRHYIAKKGLKIELFASSDPWESYFSTAVLKFLLFDLKIPVQVQVHAELSDAWAKLHLKNRLRRIFSRLTLNKAKAIRAVSMVQRSYLIEEFSLDPEKIYSIPVRLNIDHSYFPDSTRRRPISIGLVGRIHAERNIERFVEIARFFLDRNPELRIVIAGSSSGDSHLQTLLQEISDSQISFLGSLAGKDMDSAWTKIGVLISTAESESYGRSIREALMHGVPVLAFDSMGAQELKKESPQSVRLFTGANTNSEIFKMFEDLLKIRVPASFVAAQRFRDSQISVQIANSWAAVCERRQFR